NARLAEPTGREPKTPRHRKRLRAGLNLRGTDPELVELVAAPAIRCAVGRDRTRLRGAGADVREAQPARDGFGRRRARVRQAHSALPRCGLPALAVEVRSPAIGGARRRESARVTPAHAEHVERQTARDEG